jgi:hypothetical protein
MKRNTWLFHNHTHVCTYADILARVSLLFYAGNNCARVNFAHRPEKARGAASGLRHPSPTQHSRGHGPSSQPTFYGRLAQDSAFGELESAAVCQVLCCDSDSVFILRQQRNAASYRP